MLININTTAALKLRQGLLPAGWQETFRSAASQQTSRLAQTQKSPASWLAADLKVSYQPATITYQIKYFIGIYVQLCLKSNNPTLIFKSFPFSDLNLLSCVKTNTSINYFKAFIQSDGLTITLMMTWIIISVI